jgi:hypothetical protein
VPINRPQNIPGVTGHLLYEGTAPIFVTTKLQDIDVLRRSAAMNARTGRPGDAEASMLLRRLQIYEFSVRVARPRANIPHCGCCFATLLLNQAT